MKKRFDTPGASGYLKDIWGVKNTAGTLEVLRCKGRGPRYYKLNNRVYYDSADLDQYAQGQVVETVDSIESA